MSTRTAENSTARKYEDRIRQYSAISFLLKIFSRFLGEKNISMNQCDPYFVHLSFNRQYLRNCRSQNFYDVHICDVVLGGKNVDTAHRL